MPCDAMVRNEAERRAREAALEELAQQIADGSVRVTTNMKTGQTTVVGWKQTKAASSGWCEGCALAALGARAKPQSLRKKMDAVGLKKGARFTAANHAGHQHVVGAGHGGFCKGGHK